MEQPLQQRIPPHSLEAEQSVLGSMLLDQNAVSAAIETLKGEDFYLNSHHAIFDAMFDLYAGGSPVDLVTVTDKLTQKGTLERAGGVEYLSSLSLMVPSTANIAHYVSIVEDRSLLRGIIHVGSEMVGTGFEADRSAETVLSETHDKVYALTVRKRSDSLRPLSEALLGAYHRASDAMQTKGGISGTPSGYADLDRLTGGFEGGQLIILAARPGQGKTSFALNIAYNVAAQAQMPVAMFSLEMSAEDLALRMLCAEAGVNLGDARSGRISTTEFQKFEEPLRTLAQTPMFVDASGSVTVQDIRARCMRLSASQKLGLVIVDYLQLMQMGSGGRRSDSRTQEVSELTRSLKLMARDLGVPILVLSQLNRDVERRRGNDRRPMLADLRESGSIEQDADIVMFLAHESDLQDSRDQEEAFDEPSINNRALCIVAKNRNGPTDDVALQWIAEYTKFVPASPREY